VVVFDGDGNLLMNLGTLATIAASGVANFYHVVFDNGAHGSTGDQRTVSDRVPLDRIAAAAGYRSSVRVNTAESVEREVPRLFAASGPSLLLVEVERGNQPGIRRVEASPTELTARFRRAATQ